MASRTVQLPEPVFRELNALKIRIANSTGSIPVNGDIIRFALKLANERYDELVTELTKEPESES